MEKPDYLTIHYKRQDVQIDIGTILYVRMSNNIASIHTTGDAVYEMRTTTQDMEKALGDSFVTVYRGIIVAVMAIHEVDDKVRLINGESFPYVIRKKKEIQKQIWEKQKKIIDSFHDSSIPQTAEAYHEHYRSFDHMPFAFTDIEMVFNEKNHAVDWIFCYGNEELAKLEKLPLDKLIGSSFRSLFANMDSKWLKSYERAALFGEKLEIIDYSPEIDAYLDVVCFPTFKGHCGCILFDIKDLKFATQNSETERALMLY